VCFDVVVDRDVRHDPRLGGAGVNLAVSLVGLGVPVGLAASLAGDAAGQLAIATLRRRGVALLAQPPADRTGRAIVTVRDGLPTDYAFDADVHRGLVLDAMTKRRIRRAGNVVVNAFPFELAAAVEPLAAVFSDVGGLRIVDPNPRRQTLDEPGAFMRGLGAVLPHTDVLKVSDEDLALLAAGRGICDAIDTLLGYGPAAVVVTRARQGAAVATLGGTRLDVPGVDPPGTVRDTIGAMTCLDSRSADERPIVRGYGRRSRRRSRDRGGARRRRRRRCRRRR
jgi:fructokinase